MERPKIKLPSVPAIDTQFMEVVHEKLRDFIDVTIAGADAKSGAPELARARPKFFEPMAAAVVTGFGRAMDGIPKDEVDFKVRLGRSALLVEEELGAIGMPPRAVEQTMVFYRTLTRQLCRMANNAAHQAHGLP